MRNIKSIFVIGLLLGSTAASAQEIHTFHCLYGCPSGTPLSNDLIVREIYTLSSNDVTKFADWVAYRVSPDTIGPTQSRSWRADPWLSDEETLEPADYSGANAALRTDRGHQAPLAAFTGTEHWRDTNFLSNITPQSASLNQASWMRLEAAVRNLAADGSTLYVMTGPLYEGNTALMPQSESHTVPSGYWKVVLSEDGAVAGFIFPQDTPRSAAYCDYQADLTEIEHRSRLTLNPRHEGTFSNFAPTLGCPPPGETP